MRLLSFILLASAAFAQGGEWTDIPLNGLADWTRVTIPPGKTPSEPSQWSVQDGVVVCEGKGGHEMLRFNKEYKDFILHVEWRFTRLGENETKYNSGIFVRTSEDGSIWHQAQAGLGGGYIFGNTVSGGQPARINLKSQMTENRVKPAGEWNTYEITCKGPTISLAVNGKVVSEYDKTEVLKGYIALEAEGYRIEFRNIRIQTL